MTVIKFLVFVRERGAIEPGLFIASFIIMFPRAVSYFHPATVRLICIHCMSMVRIIRRQDKESWQISRGVQSTTIFFRSNRDGSWKHIGGITGSFMWAGSIINGNGRQIQIWATKIICKVIIGSVIKRTVVVLSC